MKKNILIVFIIICVVCGIFFAGLTKNTNSDTLMRLHIRANSNSASDQSVKLLVRDQIVVFLEERMENITSLSVAKKALKSMLGEVEKLSDLVLRQNGKGYKSKAKISNEFFPTRKYNDLVLESGYYDALIIELGSGEGDNWWCVIYPPLCYVEVQYGDGFRYKSKIKEIWDKYFG